MASTHHAITMAQPVHGALCTCVCVWTSHLLRTHTHTRASGGTTEAKQPTLKPPPTTTTPTPFKQASWWSLTHRLVTHTHTRGKQDKGHSKTKAVVAMACTVTMPWHKRATPVVKPPWLVHQVHAPPMQVATSTHTPTQPPHTHKRERKEELGEGPQGVERHSGVSETVPLCHPPCPQVSTPPTVRPASPPPGPPSTIHHHH